MRQVLSSAQYRWAGASAAAVAFALLQATPAVAQADDSAAAQATDQDATPAAKTLPDQGATDTSKPGDEIRRYRDRHQHLGRQAGGQ